MVQNFSSDLFAMTHDAEVDMDNIMDALNTLKSSFSGPSAPSAEQGQLWYDTTRSLLRHRGAASQWRGVIAFKDDSNYLNITKIWVYANTVEEGFTEDDDCADSVIAIRGGSNAYDTTGGDGTPKGVWAITGFVDSGHLHTMGTHGHIWAYAGGATAHDKSYNSAGSLINIAFLEHQSKYSAYFNLGGPGSGASDTTILTAGYWYTNKVDPGDTNSAVANISQNGNWRPQAAVGIMIYPAII